MKQFVHGRQVGMGRGSTIDHGDLEGGEHRWRTEGKEEGKGQQADHIGLVGKGSTMAHEGQQGGAGACTRRT